MHSFARLLLLALTLPLAASAQGRLAFQAETLDLGPIAEADGPVARTFRFTNTGDAAVRLVRVEAACGCTTPSWTSEVVPPGASGEVAVAFDPAGRPGDFDKAVFVEAEGAAPAALTLRVTGTVRSALAGTGVRVGAFAFDRVEADAGTVPEGEALQTSVQFANLSDRPVRIERVEAPAGVEVVFTTRPLFPEALGGLFITIEDPAGLAEGGALRIPLVLHTTDPSAPAKRVTVTAQVGPPIPLPAPAGL